MTNIKGIISGSPAIVLIDNTTAQPRLEPMLFLSLSTTKPCIHEQCPQQLDHTNTKKDCILCVCVCVCHCVSLFASVCVHSTTHLEKKLSNEIVR